jgi:hypothetical protein
MNRKKMTLQETLISKGRIHESSKEKLPEGVLCRVTYPICNIDVKNHNGRKYSRAVWEKVHENQEINEKLSTRTLFGHAEHPKETQSNLEKTSHIVTKMYQGEELFEGKKVLVEYADFDVLDTPYGRIVDTLLRADCGVGVSTRAEGELEEAVDEDGTTYQNVLPESYRFVTVDFTADPSTLNVKPINVQRQVLKDLQKGVESREMPKEDVVCILESIDTDESKKLVEKLNWDASEKKKIEESSWQRTVSGTYGSGQTPCDVFVVKGRSGLQWYACEGSVNVNATYDEIKDGVDVETLKDVDMFTASSPINSEDELDSAVNDGDDEDVDEKKVKEEKEVKIDTPWGKKNWSFLKKAMKYYEDHRDDADKKDSGKKDAKESKHLLESFGSGNFNEWVKVFQTIFKDMSEENKKVVKTTIMENTKDTDSGFSTLKKKVLDLELSEAGVRADKEKLEEALTQIKAELKMLKEKYAKDCIDLNKKVIETKKVVSEDTQKLERVKEKTKKIIEGLLKEKEDLSSKYKKEQERLTAEILGESIKHYVKGKINSSKLNLHKNALALLENCKSVEEVDEVFVKVRDAVREGIAHSAVPKTIAISEHIDEEQAKLDGAIGSAFKGMSR